MGAFHGFGPKALPFFKALAFHQSKEWFEENRGLYDQDVVAPMRALLSDLTEELARRKIALVGDPKRGMFRLNRDVRFSKDKAPYKTHAGAVLTRSGAKNDPGLVYIHIDPEGCFLGAGFYHPEPAELRDFRTQIRDKPARLRKLINHLEKHGLSLDDSDSLTRPPRDFAEVTDADLAAAIRLKSFIVRRPLAEKLIHDAGLVSHIADFALIIEPLIAWGRGEQRGT